MAKRFEETDQLTGIWNMATGEGSPAHKLIWEKSLARAPGGVGLLFENDQYFNQHPGRRRPCLTQAMRASMAAYFGLLISVAPDRQVNILEENHYRQIFNRSKADINFTTSANLNYQQILSRNKDAYCHLALIQPGNEHVSDIVLHMSLDSEQINFNNHTSDATVQMHREDEVIEDLRSMTHFALLEEITRK